VLVFFVQIHDPITRNTKATTSAPTTGRASSPRLRAANDRRRHDRGRGCRAPLARQRSHAGSGAGPSRRPNPSIRITSKDIPRAARAASSVRTGNSPRRAGSMTR
jgi:hypothetical protein